MLDENAPATKPVPIVTGVPKQTVSFGAVVKLGVGKSYTPIVISAFWVQFPSVAATLNKLVAFKLAVTGLPTFELKLAPGLVVDQV